MADNLPFIVPPTPISRMTVQERCKTIAFDTLGHLVQRKCGIRVWPFLLRHAFGKQFIPNATLLTLYGVHLRSRSGVVVDTPDLKSGEVHSSCRFESAAADHTRSDPYIFVTKKIYMLLASEKCPVLVFGLIIYLFSSSGCGNVGKSGCFLA
jgi:hypothetical protein